MQITRHNHLRHMAKTTPLLLALYVIQVIIYQHFAPEFMRGDINLALGLGLALIILCFHFYDLHHKIIFHPNFLEVSFEILKMKEEILYQNIHYIEIKNKKNNYAHLVLHLRDGNECHLYHVDSPELVAQFIEKKKLKAA